MKATYVYRRYAKHARNVRRADVPHVGMVRWKEIALRSSDDKQTIYANEVLSRERRTVGYIFRVQLYTNTNSFVNSP